MERTVVQAFLYPAFLSHPQSLSFSNQFAFRPTGSPEAAIISLIHIVTRMLLSNQYVVVISLDFKAFDTVRHATLVSKLAELDLPVYLYNWLAVSDHSHCTDYNGQRSSMKKITASIIQGSGIGPAAYVVTAADLQVANAGNELVKFADDTYLIIPADNIHTRAEEIENVETWARNNNLTLKKSKTWEVVFRDATAVWYGT